MSTGSKAGSSARIAPKKLSHVGIRTTRLKEMRDWYKTVLNAEIRKELPAGMVFMTYDDEHHRLVLASMGAVERPKMSAGHDHLCFTYANLGELIATYERLKAAGITPVTSVQHNLTTSFYYRDPDGNGVELSVDNLDPSEWKEWMENMSAENPWGNEIDPEQLAKQYHAGVPEKELTAPQKLGPMPFGSIVRLYE